MTPKQRQKAIGEQIRWRAFERALPPKVKAVLQTIDVLGLRLGAAEEIELTLFAWTSRRSSRGTLVDPPTARQSWQRAWTADPDAVLTCARHIVNDQKRDAHRHKLVEHETAQFLRDEHRRPEPTNGVLIVRERDRRDASFGIRSYLEVTPIEVPVRVAQLWQQRTGGIAPKVWDLTAGSGTVEEVLRSAFTQQVVSTDIVGQDRGNIFADLRDLANVANHRRSRRGLERTNEEIVVAAPELVFLDPPSRGTPTHGELYGSAWPEHDLALLERDDYVGALRSAVVRAVRRLHPAGLLSLVLREGVRADQHVRHDAALVRDVLDGLPADMQPLEQARLEEPWPINQASLATTRMPMTHLVLRRA